jgi:hypothetical protein
MRNYRGLPELWELPATTHAMPLTTAALHSAYHQGTGMAVRTLWNLGKTSVDEGRFGRLTCRIGKLLSNSLIEETRAGTKVSQWC